MRYIKFFISLAILTTAFPSSFAQVITNSKEVGGMGGGAFEDQCHPGDVLIGWNDTQGSAVNSIGPVCQPILNGIYNGPNYGLMTHGKPAENPEFIAAATPRCPPGQAIYEMHVWVDKNNEITALAATCTPLLPSTGQETYLGKIATNGVAVRDAPLTCGPSAVAIGMIGRSGDLMDSIGLKCSTFSWHNPAIACPAAPICPAPAPETFVSVLQDAELYSKPGHRDQDDTHKTLKAGTPNVKLLGFQTPDYHLRWPGGDGWVYNNFPDVVSLKE